MRKFKEKIKQYISSASLSPPDPDETFCEQIRCPQLRHDTMECREGWDPYDPWVCSEKHEAEAERQAELCRGREK